MNGPAAKLKEARIRSGIDPGTIAISAGISTPGYYDCEDHDDLVAVISMHELKGICDAVGISSRALFVESPLPEHEHISFEQLIACIKQYLESRHLTPNEFSDQVGFDIVPALLDANQAGEWCVEWLQWLCSILQLDWQRALP